MRLIIDPSTGRLLEYQSIDPGGQGPLMTIVIQKAGWVSASGSDLRTERSSPRPGDGDRSHGPSGR